MKNHITMNDRLKAAREAAGLRSATAAIEAFDWPSSTYRAHENGQNNFKVEQAKIYAAAYNVSAAWLLTGDDDKHFPTFTKLGSVTNPTNNSKRYSSGISQTSLKGYIDAGLWHELSIEDGKDKVSIKNHSSSKSDKQSVFFDLYVVDDSISGIADRGEFLRCESISKNNVEDGDIVVIRRQNKNLSQIVIKRCIQNSDGLSLIDFEPCLENRGNNVMNKFTPKFYNNNDIIGRVVSKYQLFK